MLSKAVILCGGRGTRLFPLTKRLPKPLVVVRGKPIIEHLLSWLSGQGIREFAIATGFARNEMGKWAKKAGKKWNLEIVDSGENATIFERIRHCAEKCPDEFLVCYGDTIADVDVRKLCKMHKKSGLPSTLTVYPLQSPFGIVDFNRKSVATAFREKPVLPYWMNIGFMALSRKTVLNSKQKDLIGFLESQIRGKKLSVFLHRGRHITVNTQKEKSDAEKQLEGFYTYTGGN